MPAMPRMDDKMKKIAYKILGVPQNMQDVKDKKDERIDQALIFQETVRVR